MNENECVASQNRFVYLFTRNFEKKNIFLLFSDCVHLRVNSDVLATCQRDADKEWNCCVCVPFTMVDNGVGGAHAATSIRGAENERLGKMPDNRYKREFPPFSTVFREVAPI